MCWSMLAPRRRTQRLFRGRDKHLRRSYDHAVHHVEPGGLPGGLDRPVDAACRDHRSGQRDSAGLKRATSRPLAALADDEMLGMADVAFLTKVPKSTLSRLW